MNERMPELEAPGGDRRVNLVDPDRVCSVCGGEFKNARAVGIHRGRKHGVSENGRGAGRPRRMGRPRAKSARSRGIEIRRRLAPVATETRVKTISAEAEALATIAGAMIKLDATARLATLRWLVDRFQVEL